MRRFVAVLIVIGVLLLAAGIIGLLTLIPVDLVIALLVLVWFIAFVWMISGAVADSLPQPLFARRKARKETDY